MTKVSTHKCEKCGNKAIEYIEPFSEKTLDPCDNCGWENTVYPVEIPVEINEDYEMLTDSITNKGYGVLKVHYKNNIRKVYHS